MKGQTEIIGLILIVIILTIAMLMYVSSQVQKAEGGSKDNIKQEYKHNELATSWVQAFLRTTSECGVSMDDLIKDCGLPVKRVSCGTRNSCDEVKFVVETIMEDTLDTWNYSYQLKISWPTDEYVYPTNSGCSQDKVGRGTPGVFLVPYYPTPGSARVELGICG